MTSSRVFVFSFFYLVSFQIILAHSVSTGDEIKADIYMFSRGMNDHFIRSADRIDSLEATLSDEELEANKFYFDYTDAYVAFMKGDFDKTFTYSVRALEHFLYNEEDEWIGRCLLLIGNVAASKRLIPEAITAYKHVVNYSKDHYTLSSAYLNLARNLNSLRLDWTEALRLGNYYAQLTEDDGVIANSQLASYWLHSDSTHMVVDIPLLAEKYSRMRHYTREADAYKCLVFFFLRNGNYDAALAYANLSIEAYNKNERPSKILLSSIHYLKGKVLLLLGKSDLAFEEYNTAISINNNGGYEDNNYQLYLSMYRYEYQKQNYKEACFFLERANSSLKYLNNEKLEHYYMMSDIFTQITLIEEELDGIKQANIRRTVLISALLASLFLVIIIWLRSKKRHFEKRSVDMEGKNSKLRMEAGELLMKANYNKLTSNIITNQSDLERKLAKILAHHKFLPDIIKEKYAETMLCYEVKLPMLSATEKRYAVMIALDIPYKTISEILNVKPETVAQYRNRLRKKLGIVNTKTELNTYLKSFLQE